jgi:hypothetical protein
VSKSALALHNFKTGPRSILSFKSDLGNITTSGGVITINPIGNNAGIVCLAFSVVLVTKTNSPYLELQSFTKESFGTSNSVTISANSSKFNFPLNGGAPFVAQFLEWVTFDDFNINSNGGELEYGV